MRLGPSCTEESKPRLTKKRPEKRRRRCTRFDGPTLNLVHHYLVSTLRKSKNICGVCFRHQNTRRKNHEKARVNQKHASKHLVVFPETSPVINVFLVERLPSDHSWGGSRRQTLFRSEDGCLKMGTRLLKLGMYSSRRPFVLTTLSSHHLF